MSPKAMFQNGQSFGNTSNVTTLGHVTYDINLIDKSTVMSSPRELAFKIFQNLNGNAQNSNLSCGAINQVSGHSFQSL